MRRIRLVVAFVALRAWFATGWRWTLSVFSAALPSGWCGEAEEESDPTGSGKW